MKTVVRTPRMLLLDAIILEAEEMMNEARADYNRTGSKVARRVYRSWMTHRNRAVGTMKRAYYVANPA